MNYFEILGINQDETNAEAIDAAYTQARIRWQTVLAQGVGEQQKQARVLMNGKLEEIYATLRDPASRQRYLRELKLAEENGIPVGNGRTKVSFSLSNGYGDHDFLVVENPVRHALEADGLVIDSTQEYVCRAWENPEWALQHVQDRTLERWLYYAAAQEDVVKALDYMRWRRPACLAENVRGVTLDLLQTKYPAPILPKSSEDLLERISDFNQPQWQVLPKMLHFGVVAKAEEAQAQLQIRWWQVEPQRLTATVDDEAIELDTSRLASDYVLGVAVDLDLLERGETVKATITLSCEPYSGLSVPVLVARANRVMGNQKLRQALSSLAGEVALEVGDHALAAHHLRITGNPSAAAQAEIVLIRQAYDWHDWEQVIEMGRRFHTRYGRVSPDVQRWLIEALRMVSGTLYQLGEQRRSLEHFAALAHETSQLEDPSLLEDSWTVQPEAQFRIDVDNPKSEWVAIAEEYGLNWTHPTGRADGSNYAGEVPLDLSARRVIWRTENRVAVQAPLIASQGMLVARTRDRRWIVGLDAASGAVTWLFDEGMNGSQPAVPVAGDGQVFVADPTGGLYGLDVLTGRVNWRAHLGEGGDISLAYDGGLLFAGTGQRFILLDGDDGSELASLDEMRSLGMKANPVNLLITKRCCLFQKVGGAAPSMVFVDTESGRLLEFELPFVGHSLLKSIGRNLLGLSATAAVTWAAWGEFVALPCLITKEIECKQKIRDADGREHDDSEKQSWQELHLFIYGARFDERVAHVFEVVSGTAYQEGRGCKVRIIDVRAANACAITPTQIEEEEGTRWYGLPDPELRDHLLIAAGFGREIFYWALDSTKVQRVGYRIADGDVQSIAFLGRYDMVTTRNAMMTSFMGQVEDGNATAFVFPDDMDAIVGSPALYGDLIFVTTKAGEVAAIGR